MAPVFDFWERAARAYRFDDGTRQASDADGAATPYRAHARRDPRRSAAPVATTSTAPG